MTISHSDIQFKLEFPVGRKYVAGIFNLRKGEDTSTAVDQFMSEFDIPPYLSVSILNMVESMLEQEYILYNDQQDILQLKTLKLQDTTESFSLDSSTLSSSSSSSSNYTLINSKINELAHQYSEKTNYWNSLVKNEITEEQKLQDEKIKIFLYLVQKSTETKEKIINQEELFATSFNILLSRRKEELEAINEEHSKEMQEVANKGIIGEEIERMVSENVKRLDQVEAKYDIEIKTLKKKQKEDFTTFLNDLYWLETTKDELKEVDDEFNNITKSQTTPPLTSPLTQSQQQQVVQQQQDKGVLTGTIDKVQQRASSFFNFGFGKKNQQPAAPATTSSNNLIGQTGPSLNNTSSPSSQQQQQQQQQPNSNNNTDSSSLNQTSSSSSSSSSQPLPISNEPKRKDSFGTPGKSPSKQTLGKSFLPIPNILSGGGGSDDNKKQKEQQQKEQQQQKDQQQEKMFYRVLECCLIAVGVQKKKLFEFKLIDASPLQLCRPVSTGEYLKSKRMEYISTLYSDSLSAVILLADPSLGFNSLCEKMFVQYCNMSTELHFDSIDEQIEQFKQSIGPTTQLKNGDFFITKHSNLSDVQVVFHLFADKKNRTPWGESQLLTSSDLAKGLRNILLTASKYGIGTLTIPIALTETTDVEMNITNNTLANRTSSILSVTRASLTSLHEMTSIKTIQFSIPSSLDGGNTQGQGPVSSKWRSAINPFIYETVVDK
ncbi:hypothetical protein DFA_03294 [Cavenderia fasciculata]|uniref:Uncharacterized protein n=1 Tax=Cavenderia fasciculata TaxID=261658 RepID=F4PH64_CACFS|nr:uncharacterized protein DFA_03294 [Cavenderia fasciculata]EGG25048.1 hypothetical protein DFA_03294 [Cavenderia fasciculata]|eukprot:XP_004362899.1 hypothetical protein DFA_03294 [Cavenderia fasciculata]